MSSLATASESGLSWQGDHWRFDFQALGCPAQLLIDTEDRARAIGLYDWVIKRALAFEAKFSRYREDSLCSRINNAQGQPVAIDAETYRLLCLADNASRLSDGLFDLTSGVLRHAWRFDGGTHWPSDGELAPLLARVGWHKVEFDTGRVRLPQGMELDFGGLGKEFLVDTLARELDRLAPGVSVLVNLGGDLAVSHRRSRPWRVGLPNGTLLALQQGALATSGDTERYVRHKGCRWGHILDPRTGRPVAGAPAQITVAGPLCTQAGLLSTLAMLQGDNAECFLTAQGQTYWLSH